MEIGYKFRIYPTAEQEALIQKTFGCCRYVWNYYLNKNIETYKQGGKALRYFGCCGDLTQLKKSLEWLREVDATALLSSLQDLDTAYKNFFHRVKKGGKPGFPKFKSKHNHRQHYRSKQTIKVLDNAIQLPKLGLVKCRVSRDVKGRILSATVSCNPSGKYYVSLCCTDVEAEPLPHTGAMVGVDLGVSDLAITSDGKKYPNNRYTYKAEKRLKRLQRSLSRKTKGSANRGKARIKVARLQEHIANQRADSIHKATTEIIRNYDVICIEDLNVSGMVKNHHLAKAVADASFYEFRRQLEYKAKWYGKIVQVIDRFYPSSQLCSDCGAQWAGTKDLNVRKWICPECGAEHDRDINAAKNILNEGLRLMA